MTYISSEVSVWLDKAKVYEMAHSRLNDDHTEVIYDSPEAEMIAALADLLYEHTFELETALEIINRPADPCDCHEQGDPS